MAKLDNIKFGRFLDIAERTNSVVAKRHVKNAARHAKRPGRTHKPSGPKARR